MTGLFSLPFTVGIEDAREHPNETILKIVDSYSHTLHKKADIRLPQHLHSVASNRTLANLKGNTHFNLGTALTVLLTLLTGPTLFSCNHYWGMIGSPFPEHPCCVASNTSHTFHGNLHSNNRRTTSFIIYLRVRIHIWHRIHRHYNTHMCTLCCD